MKYIFLVIIKLYQLLISPLLGNNCRFMPTCSNYCYKSIKEHGAIKGISLAVKRIAKCHPWHEGGYDPVPNKK